MRPRVLIAAVCVGSLFASGNVVAQTQSNAATFLKPYLAAGTNQLILRQERLTYTCEDASIRRALNHILGQADIVLSDARQRGVGVATTVEMSSAVLNRASDYMQEASKNCNLDYRKEIGKLKFIAKRNDAVLREIKVQERKLAKRNSNFNAGEVGRILQGVAQVIGQARAEAAINNAQGGFSNGDCTTDFEVTC